MTLARRTEVSIEWQGVDVSLDVNAALLGLSYTDHLTGAADDLSIEVQDRGGLWTGDWRPAFGDKLVARLRAESWFTGVTDLRLGTYYHDSIGSKGPPKTATLRCVSASLKTGLRRERKSRAWSGVSLKQIAQDIADGAGLSLQWGGGGSDALSRREQKSISDLDFLSRECTDQGLSLKVTEDSIVIFNELDLDKQDPVGTIDVDSSARVLSWNFGDDNSDRYSKCVVKCAHGRKGKAITGTFEDASIDGPVLEVRRHVETQGDAERLARALLRQSNSGAVRGSMTTVGDCGLVAGVVFKLAGAYGFDGKFIITKAAHRPIGGYKTEIEFRRCLEGY